MNASDACQISLLDGGGIRAARWTAWVHAGPACAAMLVYVGALRNGLA